MYRQQDETGWKKMKGGKNIWYLTLWQPDLHS